MKLAVVSHSLVADRQRWFFDYFRQYTGWDVRLFAPRKWASFVVPDGYDTMNTGDMTNFEFQQEMLLALEKFHPDLIYCQQEAYCKVSGQMMKMAKRMGSKYALFVWENIHQYDAMPYGTRLLLEDCDLVVCGNGDAEALVRPFKQKTLRCIQVGLNTDVFNLHPNATKNYSVIFVGRKGAPEKGGEVLAEASKGTDWKILWPEERSKVPYDQLPARYNSAKVHAAPSIDTPLWREQSPGGYASLEAISCGLRNVTTNSGSMIEGLSGCPGVWFSKQNDPVDLRRCISEALTDGEPNLEGRQWVIEHYGNETVAQRLLAAFKELV